MLYHLNHLVILMQQVKQNKKPTSERSWDSARATVSDRVMNLGQNRGQDASSSPLPSPPPLHAQLCQHHTGTSQAVCFCLFHHNQMRVVRPSGPHCLKPSFSVFLCTWPLQDASFFFFLHLKKSVDLFLVALGRCCCTWALSRCGSGGCSLLRGKSF